MQSLIQVKVCPALTFGEVDQPVKHKLCQGKFRRIWKVERLHDKPEHTGMNKAVGRKAIDPERGGSVAHVIYRFDMPIFMNREKLALERKVSQGVADDKGKQKDRRMQ